jgi:prepilin-type N-terminal cleavage/methylation domain-containing protein
MSRFNGHRRDRVAIAGFTLLELMVAMSISVVIFTAVLGAYIFLGRNLTRLANIQKLEVADRRAIYLFTRDVSTAQQITATATPYPTIALTIPQLSPLPPSKTVTYQFRNGALYRAATPPGSPEDVSSDITTSNAQILGDLTAFAFNYFGMDGSLLAPPLSGNAIKFVEFTFTTSTGDPANGTQTTFTATSPRVALRNKPFLQ